MHQFSFHIIFLLFLPSFIKEKKISLDRGLDKNKQQATNLNHKKLFKSDIFMLLIQV